MRACFALFFLLCPVVRAGEIVFHEDFEQFNPRHWDDISGWGDSVKIVDNGHQGKCLQVTATAGKNTGGSLFKMLDPALETCHLRFYVKFDANHGYIHHFVHLCAYNPPTLWPQGGAGERPAATSALPPA